MLGGCVYIYIYISVWIQGEVNRQTLIFFFFCNCILIVGSTSYYNDGTYASGNIYVNSIYLILNGEGHNSYIYIYKGKRLGGIYVTYNNYRRSCDRLSPPLAKRYRHKEAILTRAHKRTWNNKKKESLAGEEILNDSTTLAREEATAFI